MSSYRKKPIVVEAQRFFSDRSPLPFNDRGPYVAFEDGRFYVTTIHGEKAYLADGDWVILEPRGQYAAYPCKPDIFEATYEAVQPNETQTTVPQGTSAPSVGGAETLLERPEGKAGAVEEAFREAYYTKDDKLWHLAIQGFRAFVNPIRAVVEERDEMQARANRIAATLEQAVCTAGCDKGVILLSDHGTTHTEGGHQVYDHEHFSPLGDALIAAWELAKCVTNATAMSEADASNGNSRCVNQDTQAILEEIAPLPDLSRMQSGWASPGAVDEMSTAIATLRAALLFIADLTAEALETVRVGTGAEVALRHAHRRAKDALEVRTR